MTTPLGAIEVGPREGRRVTIARTTNETDDHGHARARRRGSHRHRHRDRLLRPSARLARPPRPVRPRHPRRRRPPGRRAPHGRGRRARARRRLRRGARRPGRASPGSGRARSRWTNRSPRPSSTSAAGRTPSSTCRSAASAPAGLPLQLVEHALEAFARTAGATLHLSGHRPQRPPPRRGRVQGTRPGPARRLRDRPAARGRRLDQGRPRMTARPADRGSPSSTTAPATWSASTRR